MLECCACVLYNRTTSHFYILFLDILYTYMRVVWRLLVVVLLVMSESKRSQCSFSLCVFCTSVGGEFVLFLPPEMMSTTLPAGEIPKMSASGEAT